MLVLLLIAVQAGPPAPAAPPARIDLRPLATPQRCSSGGDGEIVVCARPRDSDRLAKIPERYVEPRLRPEVRVLGGKASARAEQRGTLSGSAPALMFDFTLPF